MINNIIKDLEERHLISEISNKNKIIKLLKKKINIYCGFDPTNESLHLGHLIPLISLIRFHNFGYKIIIIIGETTANIGDPSFREKNRKNLSEKKIKNFSKKIKNQIKNFFKNINNLKILNNKKWFNKIKLSFFLKKICKNFSVNQMLNKEAIKIRNKKNIKGLSFSELSYNILQSFDFLYLFKNFNVKLQIGGSDQWGNILSGIFLIKKIYKKETFGLTLPLITNKKGKKLEKTEKKNIWLDPIKTTPYEFFQFWLNISDKNIYKFLKQFTFLNIKIIKKIKKKKNIFIAKKLLAKKVTIIVHGKKETKDAMLITYIFFYKLKKNIIINDLNFLFKKKIPKLIIKNNIFYIKEILILLNIVKSKTKASILIENKSIIINNKKKILDKNYKIKKEDKLFNKYTIICKGKKFFYLIKWEN